MIEIDLLGLRTESLEVHQVLVRCIITFIAAVISVHIAGMRIFGRTSALDNVMVLMIGAILGRSTVVPQPFFESLAAVLFLSILHRFVAHASFRNRKVGVFFKGDRHLLYENGKFLVDKMERVRISENDIMEAVRTTLRQNDLKTIKEIYLERSGNISIVSESSP
jgi:uncharacterized membrane protein YcaP (DUF421 family)